MKPIKKINYRLMFYAERKETAKLKKRILELTNQINELKDTLKDKD